MTGKIISNRKDITLESAISALARVREIALLKRQSWENGRFIMVYPGSKQSEWRAMDSDGGIRLVSMSCDDHLAGDWVLSY